MTIDKAEMLQAILRNKNTPKSPKVYRDFVFGDLNIKNVPCIENPSSESDPYVLTGKTLDGILSIVRRMS